MTEPERLQRARSFAVVANEYEHGRPGYPAAAIEWALGAQPLDVLDVGAGTGKLTQAVAAAGHRVIAVEPLAEMRALLEAGVPGAEVLAGKAEQLPLGDASVDAVVAGAAFHWFDQEPALAEIGRVLRPGGTLALLGNSFDTAVPWQGELRQILGPATLGRPGHWPEPDHLTKLFTAVDEETFPHSGPMDLPKLRDYASSRSGFAVLAPEVRAERLGEIDSLWERTPELSSGGEMRWLSRVLRCRGLRARPAGGAATDSG
jgi:SAM-dependent methyltransferase